MRLYISGMSLLNVRLDEADARMAAALRKAGVPMSTLVRDAIRAEYARRIASTVKGRPSAIVAEILASLPDPPDMPPREVSIADRRAVRRHIAAKLERRRP